MRIATSLCVLVLFMLLVAGPAQGQSMVTATISNPIEGEQYEHDKSGILCLGTCSAGLEPIVVKLVRPNGSVHDDEALESIDLAPNYQWGAFTFPKPMAGWPEYGDWKVKIYHNGNLKDTVTFRIKSPPTGPP